MTAAEERCSGRSPGAQPRGPRPGRAADGAARPTRSSRPKETASAAGRTRSHPANGRGGAGSAAATAVAGLGARGLGAGGLGARGPRGRGPRRGGSRRPGRPPGAAAAPGAAARHRSAGARRARARRRGTARPRCTWARQPRPVTRWCRSQGTSTIAQAGLQHVDGQADLDAPAAGEGRGPLDRRPGQAAHPRQRLRGAPAGELLDPAPGEADDEAVPAPRRPLRRQDRDREVGLAGRDRRHERADGPRRSPRGRRRRRAGAAAGRTRPAAARSCSATAPAPLIIASALPWLRGCRTTSAPAARAQVGGAVGAAVVDDDDEVDARDGGGRRDGGGDPGRLVLGGDDDGDGQRRSRHVMPSVSAG